MDSLKRFFSNKKMKIQKMLGEDRIMDSLKRFFLPKKILKFKKGWEKIGLLYGLPYLFFSNLKKMFF